MHDYISGDGRRVRLGAQIAKAGEGTISHVAGHPNWVAKIFHANLDGRQAKVQKVRAMAQASPTGAVQRDGFVVLAWPEQYLLDATSTVRGFVMPKIDTATSVEIHKISNPADREHPNPSGPQWPKGTTWTHLVNVAANLCVAVQTAHDGNAVIGDFNERNILVSNTTRVSLVDCDSFQFRAGARVFTCGVGRPEFLAPELASVDLKTYARDRSSDLFVLAVHIYLLLMAGNHPFSRGVWSGHGQKPDPLPMAAAGNWAGGPKSKLQTHPAAPPTTILPPAVRNLFERALGAGARNPALRPSADEWRHTLTAVTLRTCQRNRMHTYPAHNTSCPWCALAQRHQSSAPPTAVPPQATVVPPAVVAATAPLHTTAPIARPPLHTTAPIARPPRTPQPAPAAAAQSARNLRRHREADGMVIGSTVAAALTILIPWLLGHFLLRGRLFNFSPLVFDAEVRAVWPYFWSELRGGWAMLALVAGAALALRPWQGRRTAAIAGVAMVVASLWLGSAARAGFDAAETDAVAKLRTTQFPYDDRYLECGNGLELTLRAAKNAPIEAVWQLRLGSVKGYTGRGCNRVHVYRGWTLVDTLDLPPGIEFQQSNDDFWVFTEENGKSFDSGWDIWGYDPGRVWLNVRTTDNRVVATNLRDAANNGLTIR